MHEGITTTYLYSVQFCEKTRYFLPLEEDWELVKTPKIGFIDKTIKLLDKGPHSLMGIVFKDTCKRKQPEETLNITINDNEKHTILYSHKRVYSYSNGGSIYRMSNMKELIGDGKLDRRQSYELSIRKLQQNRACILDWLTLLTIVQNHQETVMVSFITLALIPPGLINNRNNYHFIYNITIV